MSLLDLVLAELAVDAPPMVAPVPAPAPAPVPVRLVQPEATITAPMPVVPATRPRVQLTLLDALLPPPTAEEREDAPPAPRSELARVLSLPRIDAIGTAPDLTDELLLPGAEPWPGRLKPAQNAALHQARTVRGLLAPIGVGGGKTLISALLPTVLGARRAVLLVPPDLIYKTERAFERLRKHWDMLPPGRLHIVSYNQLSSPRTPTLLEDIGPQLVMADEAHALKADNSVRTKRFGAYRRAHPDVIFCPMSGTFTTKSLYDYWHLSRWALGDRSPLPTHYHEVGVWDVVFGTMAESDRYAARGSGKRIAVPGPESEYVERKILRWAEPHVDALPALKDESPARRAFRARLVSAPGVVATSLLECDASLRIQCLRPAIPTVVQAQIDHLAATWELFEDEISDALAYARVSRQLHAGFAYRWIWPGGAKDWQWLGARKTWCSEVREFTSGPFREGLDSEALVAAACVRRDPRVRRLWAAWDAWEPMRHRYPAPDRTPPVETVWLSEFLVAPAIEAAGNDAIIFVSSDAMEDAFARAGLEMFGAGKADAERITRLAEDVLEGRTPPRTICCKLGPHHKGRDLQGWNRMVVVEPPSGGGVWEQLLGRMHRQGQRADTVNVTVFTHGVFESALEAARVSARYQQETTGKLQLLLLADQVHGDGGAIDRAVRLA